MDNKNNYLLKDEKGTGKVYLADDVVAMIAGLAAIRDVEGVFAVGESTKKSIATYNVKKAAKGVKIEMLEDGVKVDISLAIAYGYNIPETCAKVQKKVQSTIENMTGLAVKSVNLRIAGLNME